MRIKSIEETRSLAAYLAQQVTLGTLICLDGDLGVGKTTFTQAFGKALGIKRAIKSPTYSIVKEYPLHEGRLIHIDAYRLEEGGAETIDFDAYLDEQGIIVVEWPQFLEDYLPERYYQINIKRDQEGDWRQFTIETKGDLPTLRFPEPKEDL